MTALIIVDPQFDFGDSTGALYVPKGEEVVNVINTLRQSLKPDVVVITQDYHPSDHVSFAINNPGTTESSQITLPDGTIQTMWPVHCVQNSDGGAFLKGLDILNTDYIVRKGQNKNVDSYSGFGSADGIKENTNLDIHLKTHGIKNVVICGLAYDYCVSYTARDAAKYGFKTYVVSSACRGLSEESCASETALMKSCGVTIVEDIIKIDLFIN